MKLVSFASFIYLHCRYQCIYKSACREPTECNRVQKLNSGGKMRMYVNPRLANLMIGCTASTYKNNVVFDVPW